MDLWFSSEDEKQAAKLAPQKTAAGRYLSSEDEPPAEKVTKTLPASKTATPHQNAGSSNSQWSSGGEKAALFAGDKGRYNKILTTDSIGQSAQYRQFTIG